MKIFILMIVCAIAAAPVVHGKEGSVLEWLSQNKDTTLFGALLSSLYNKPAPPNAQFTVLVPTNKAIETFLKGMGLTPEQFRSRKQLVDMVVAYHIIPGYQAQETRLSKSPASAATGDINYLLRFRNADKGGVVVQDVQGHEVTINSKPVLINKGSILVVDKVLMSGSYFFNGKDALDYYPQWSEAAKFAQSAGYPANTASGMDITMFVPDNKAFSGVNLSGLSQQAKQDIIKYHVVTPARFIPTDFKNGRVSTALAGRDLIVDIKTDTSKKDPLTGGANQVPTVTLTTDAGKTANVNVYNIFVGKGIFQGVNGLLSPKLDGSSSSGSSSKTTTEAAAKPKTGGNRKLLSRGRSYSSGSSQMYANTVASENTSRAIEAAATGQIPTSYATHYGSYQAQQAATYGDCLNCWRW